MSRSIKDLRELINISRLSYHGDQVEYLSEDEAVENELKPNLNLHESCQETSKLKPRTKLEIKHPTRLKNPPSNNVEASSSTVNPWHKRFTPLPSIKSSKTCTSSGRKTTKIDYRHSCDVLRYIDQAVVSSWLVRANDTIHSLSNWLSTENFFVRFAQFWLSDMNKSKQKELVEMEVEIILDEISFAVQIGKDLGQISEQDVISFFHVVVWEYPSKLHGKQCCLFLLNTLLTLASGKKDEYRRLLSNVKHPTKNPEHVHWILSVRSFALISVVSSIVKFYSSLKGYTSPGNGNTTCNQEKLNNLKDYFAFDAVKLGYTDVLVYLVSEQNVDISQLKDENNLSLLFSAVAIGQEEITEFILKVSSNVDMCQVSNSGNGLMHAAVNTGKASLVKLLLAAGANVNQVNKECDGATPLHLAIMQGDSDMVSILLSAGADMAASMESPTTATPLKLAQDLEMLDIVDLLRRTCIQ